MVKEKNIKPNYKKTPVGIIPEDWEVKSIGKLGKVITGSTPKTSVEEYYDGDELFVSPADIQGNTYVARTGKTLTKLGLQQGRIIPDSSVMFVCIGSTIGKVAINRREAITNQQINSIVPNKKNHFYFLFNILKQRAGRIKLLAANQAVPILNKSEFSKIKLPIPPLPEQKAIADCLSTWDRAIEKQTQLIHVKKEFKKGLMQGFFNGQLSIINDQLVKAKEGQDFTEDWEEVKFKNIFLPKKVIAGENCEEYEVLSVTKNGIVSQKEYFNKSVASSNKTNYLVIKKGDFVLSGLNFWMGSYDVLTEYSEGVISPAYKVFSITPRKDKAFIYSLIKTDKFLRSMVGSSVQGASIVRRNLDKDMMMNWKFKMPILELQMKIGQVLQSADQEIELLEKKLEQLQLQKKGLMQVLLTGEKRLV